MKTYRKYIAMLSFFFSAYLYAEQLEYTGQCGLNGIDNYFESCLDKELARYDKELNEVYSSFFKKKPNKELKKIERLWVQLKEADCSYIANEVHGGYYFQFVYRACLINKTKARIADLKRPLFYYGWFYDSRPHRGI